MLNYTIQKKTDSSWTLLVFWGRMHVADHQLSGSVEEMNQQKEEIISGYEEKVFCSLEQ